GALPLHAVRDAAIARTREAARGMPHPNGLGARCACRQVGAASAGRPLGVAAARAIVAPMSLKGIAKETLQILEDGRYVAPSGRTVSLEPAIDEAIGGTRLWRPAELAELLALAGAFE